MGFVGFVRSSWKRLDWFTVSHAGRCCWKVCEVLCSSVQSHALNFSTSVTARPGKYSNSTYREEGRVVSDRETEKLRSSICNAHRAKVSDAFEPSLLQMCIFWISLGLHLSNFLDML